MRSWTTMFHSNIGTAIVAFLASLLAARIAVSFFRGGRLVVKRLAKYFHLDTLEMLTVLLIGIAVFVAVMMYA